MQNIILSSLLALTLGSVGCSKGTPTSCDDIVDHTASFMPDELKEQVLKDKAKAVAKCEKLSPEAKKCAAEASSVDDLMKCPHS